MPNTHSKSQNMLWAPVPEECDRSDIQPSALSFLVLCLVYLRYLEIRLAEAQKVNQLGGQFNKETGLERIAGQPLSTSALLSLPEIELGKKLDTAIMWSAGKHEHFKEIVPISFQQLDQFKLNSLLRILASMPRFEVSEFGDVQAYLVEKYVNNRSHHSYPVLPPKLLLKRAIEILYPDNELIASPANIATVIMESAQFVAHLCNLFCPHREQDIKKGSTHSYAEDKKMAKDEDEYSGTIQLADFFSASPHITKDKKFDKILANPPFNMRGLNKSALRGSAAFPFKIPEADNANYLFIQGIFNALDGDGRACFFMPEAASDACGSELKIREELILTGCVDAIIACGPIFYGTKARGTLWLLDKGKINTYRRECILFIDARQFKFNSFTSEQLLSEQTELLLYAVRLYRKEAKVSAKVSLVEKHFPQGRYQDVDGFCKVVTLAELESNEWSLNPKRYIKIRHQGQEDSGIFKSRVGRDKNMNNEQQLVTLLSKAFEIYREWFVNWHYPGTEADISATSNQEELPARWCKAKLSDVCEVISGFKVKKYDENSDQRIILSKCVRDGYINVALARGHSIANMSSRVLEPRLLRVGDILVNSSGVGSLGRVAQVYKNLINFTVDSHINIVRAKHNELIDYLSLALQNLKPYFNEQAIGTTGQRRLRKDTLANTEIAIPPRDILNLFNEQISAIRANILDLLD